MSDGPFVAVDLGGTKILVLIANGDGHVLSSVRKPTLATEGQTAVIDRIVETVREAAAEAGVTLPSLGAAGISAPGPIDRDEGVITDPPNLPGWHNVPLAQILQERLGMHAVLENDANCGALGEHQFGAGRGCKDMLYVTISTGIGGGMIVDGKLYAGASGAAGEVGHIGVAIDGPRCGAGHVGCLEALASGTAIAAQAREAIGAGRMPVTAKLAEQEPPLSAKSVYDASQQGEEEARSLITRAGTYFGMGLATLINVFNPQAIVVGGGLVNMGEAILKPAIETARNRSFAQSFSDTRILVSELRGRAAALGAIAVAREAAAADRAV